jgi:hypothetical protein
MKNSSYNIFSELNTDTHPLNAKTTMMVDAINAALTTEGENQLILQNMKGNESFAKLKDGYRPVGVSVFNNVAYILSAEFDDKGKFVSGEIGTFPSPDWAKLNQAVNTGGKTVYRYKTVPMLPVYAPLRNFIPFATSDSVNDKDALLNNDINYKEEFNTAKFNLLSDRMVEIELQPSYDDSMNIIITDNYNPIRLINSRFVVKNDAKSASLADRRQNKDTNTYSDERFNSTILIKSSDKVLDLVFDGVIKGGSHKGGGYRFFFRYMDSDGTLTDIIEESRLVVFGYDNYGANKTENTGKAVKFTLNNLDKKFSAVKVYFAKGDNNTSVITTVYEIVNIYDIAGDSMTITIFGDEDTLNYNADKLNLSYSSINTVRTITQFDDRLLLGNLTSKARDYDELKTISQNITIRVRPEELAIEKYDRENDSFIGTTQLDFLGQPDPLGYVNPKNVYNKLGVWAGETYEVGIVYILSDYTLSPAIPVRGIDHYDSFTSYTNRTNFGADGFIPDSTENNLGIYRTFKTKTLIYSNNDEQRTGIFFLRLDFSNINSSQKQYLKDNTLGYFITRKERKKDCIVQGYITNTTRVPVAQKIATTGKFSVTTGGSEWTGEKDQIHIQDIDGRSGSYVPDKNYPFKIIPAPGRITECHLDSEGGSPETDISRFKSISSQGVVLPDPNYTYANTKVKGVYPETYWAFYTADQLTNPALMASVFNGSEKGVLLNFNPVRAFVNISKDKKESLKTASLPTYTHPSDKDDGATRTLRPWRNATITFQLISATSTTQTFRIRFTMTATFNIAGKDVGDVVATIVVASNNIIQSATFNYTEGFSYSVSLTWEGTTFPFIKPNMQPGFIGNMTMTTKNVKVDGAGYPEYSFSNIPIYLSSATFGQSTAPEDQSTEPIKLVRIDTTGNLKTDFVNPKNNIPGNKYFFKYIGYNTDAYNNNQFSAIEDRNLYYASTIDKYANGNSNWSAGLVQTGGNCNALFTSITQFSEYIGLRALRGDNELVNNLNNDPFLVNNHTLLGENSALNALNALDLYRLRLENSGFNLAVIANIYNSVNGVLTQNQWKLKYNSSSSVEPYFAVTKRLKWDDAWINGSNSFSLDVYGGDCYVNYVFKRIMSQRGIPGVDTATDMKAYNNFNQAVGLMPKGFIMPIVTENNYNVSLRTEDSSYPTEAALYSQARTFYPVKDEDTIRATKQRESDSYNFGYNDDIHDKVFLGLNDRAPAFNTNYSNRVMVSSPGVSGSFSNGYIDFSGLNFKDYNKQFGQIVKLISHNNDVYCIFEQGVGIIPINQKTMLSGDTGGIFVDNAQILATKMQVLSTEYGSDQQFSIIKTDLAVYGCDLRKNKIWKVTKDEGLSIISDFAVQSVVKGFKERIIAGGSAKNFVKANYDRELNQVLFSYYNIGLSGEITTNYLKDAGTSSEVRKENTIGTLYWNETIQKWVSKLSWNPLWSFNIQNKLYSFNALKNSHTLWRHFSNKVPYCNFYGEQEKFMFEFVVVDKPTMQKILHNLTIVSNRAFPSSIEYTLLETDHDFDGPKIVNNNYVDYVKQRHEFLDTNKITLNVDPNGTDSIIKIKPTVSKEEAERVKGGWILDAASKPYLLSDLVQMDPLDKNSFYHKLKDENGKLVTGLLTNQFSVITFGIINQNVDYIEDHLYVEVGNGENKSRIRDKAIKVKITYEGYDYVTIQTVLSYFVYSFN